MRKLNTYVFYNLAMLVAPLAKLSYPSGVVTLEIWLPFYQAMDALRRHIDSNDILPPPSMRAAKELVVYLHELIGDSPSKEIIERKIESWEISSVVAKVEAFQIVLASDLPGLDTYIVSPKSIYSTTELVENADHAILSSLPDDCHQFITNRETRDFREAGRCLAFELFTASGFHVMRATESIIKRYWQIVTNAADEGSLEKPLYHCIKELKEKGEPEHIIAILDHVRDLNRNPIMHPDAFIEPDEALRLFDISKSAICGVARRMRDLRGQLPLPLPVSPLLPEIGAAIIGKPIVE